MARPWLFNRARSEGRNAAALGTPRAQNPYRQGPYSEGHPGWNAGWDDYHSRAVDQAAVPAVPNDSEKPLASYNDRSGRPYTPRED